jgi:hypothetical protein
MGHDSTASAEVNGGTPFAEARGSEASWWVYYLPDEGKAVYITAVPLPFKRAQAHSRAAQRYYYFGRPVVQITETPPNNKLCREAGQKGDDEH